MTTLDDAELERMAQAIEDRWLKDEVLQFNEYDSVIIRADILKASNKSGTRGLCCRHGKNAVNGLIATQYIEQNMAVSTRLSLFLALRAAWVGDK
jgi:predicted nucleic acid-binding protein